MHSKKEYEAKIRKTNRKIEELKKKLSSSQSANKELRATNKYLRRRVKILLESRDEWKAKLKSKQLKVKLLKNKIRRQDKPKRHHYTTWLITLCILLRTKCNCSYGSIVKILRLLNIYFHLKLVKIPCENTVQNWVSKVGLYQLESVFTEFMDKEVTIIIDESIRLGQEKLLVMLICPFIKHGENALNFTDVKVVYMKGSKSWKGLEIAKEIQKSLIDQKVNVVNVLSDEGNNLTYAARLLKLDYLPEIAHAIATCLRQTFEKDAAYRAFIKLTTSYLTKGVNQNLSYLIPPKVNKKARFMNQSKVVHWAELMLANWEKLTATEKIFFVQLTKHKKMIQTLNTCITIAKTIGLILKKEGLSNKTLRKVNKELEKFNTEKGLINTFLTKIKGYLARYKHFLSKHPSDCCIHISTDIIESLFGKYKNKANNYALTGLTKLNLELPLYCTEEKEITQLAHLALEDIFMTHLCKWVDEHSTDNQLVRSLNCIRSKQGGKNKKKEYLCAVNEGRN
jgi:hypothetical protein